MGEACSPTHQTHSAGRGSVSRILLSEDTAYMHYPRAPRRDLGVRGYGARSRRLQVGDTVAAALITSRWKVAYLPEVRPSIVRPGSLLRSGNQAKLEFLEVVPEIRLGCAALFHDRKDYPDGYRCEVLLGILRGHCAPKLGGCEAGDIGPRGRTDCSPCSAALQAIRIRSPALQFSTIASIRPCRQVDGSIRMSAHSVGLILDQPWRGWVWAVGPDASLSTAGLASGR